MLALRVMNYSKGPVLLNGWIIVILLSPIHPEMGPGASDCNWHDLPIAWDKPADQAEIMLGIELYRTLSSLYMSPFGENMIEKRSGLRHILIINREQDSPS